MTMTLALAAGAASGGLALLHIVAGGRAIARPLIDARDIGETAKYTNYYCWHLVSIVLVLMSAGFFFAAFRPDPSDLTLLLTAIAAAFAVWGIVLPVSVGQSYGQMPQGWLFVPIAALGLGILLS